MKGTTRRSRVIGHRWRNTSAHVSRLENAHGQRIGSTELDRFEGGWMGYGWQRTPVPEAISWWQSVAADGTVRHWYGEGPFKNRRSAEQWVEARVRKGQGACGSATDASCSGTLPEGKAGG